MVIGNVEEILERKPFRRFRIVTTDGESILVKSPEFVWFPPAANRIIWVATGKGDETHMIDVHMVTKFILENGTSVRGQ